VSSGSVASPLSTGGAGTIYEYRVAAVVLAALLRGDRVEGLEVPVTEVGLQQRIAGSYLDDVTAVAEHAGAVLLRVEFQVKRAVDPVPSNAEWRSVIAQCIAAFEADPDGVRRRHHLLGLAARAHAGHLGEVAELTRWAREHHEAGSFITVISAGSGAPNAQVRNRWQHLRTTVKDLLTEQRGTAPSDTDVTETAFWIAAALRVWVVEAEDGERDHRDTLNRLGDLLPPDQPEAAQNAFVQLADIAQARATRAGRIGAAALRAELERRHVPLTADPRARADLAELDRWTAAFLDSTRHTVAGTFHLPRAELLGQVSDAVREHDRVLVTGRAGAGKSALARIAARAMRADGATVVGFSLTERSWRTLAEVETDLHARLDTALRGAATTSGRLLLIDGAERVLSDAGALLNSVLQAVPRGADSLPWHVLVTARDEAADAVAGILAQGQPGAGLHRVVVADLSDSEVGEVIAAFPHLQPLDRHERPRQLLLRRPYLVDLLVRGSAGAGLPERMLAEEDVVRLVFERLIRRADGALPGQGAPDARSDIYLAMADAVIAGNTSTRLDGRDAQARAGLVSDNILDRAGASFRFSHDVLADYAVATRLREPDSAMLISTLTQPRRLLRGIRLWMQLHLADSVAGQSGTELPARWGAMSDVAAGLAATDGPRWLDVPYEALLNIGPVEEVLRQLTGSLAANDGAGLARLIDVTQRLARPRHDGRVDSGPEMDITLSEPIVGLLAGLGDELPAGVCASAARLVCSHLRSLPSPPEGSASELVPRAAGLPAAVMAWAEACQLRRAERDAVEAIAMLAAHLDTAGEDFLLGYARQEPERIGQVIEEPFATSALAGYRPHLLFRLSFWYFLGLDPDASQDDEPARPRWARKGFDRRDQGVRPHALRRDRAHTAIDDLAHSERGPFAALLEADPQHGRRLAGAVVDAATAARARTEAEWGQAEVALELKLSHWQQPRTYRGTPSVWGWYRRLGTGAFPAMSALMALRAWAAGRRQAGAPLRQVVDDVLHAGTSLAFAAVAVSVLVHDIDNVSDELDPFLARPLIWELENARAAGELTGPALRDQDWPRSGWTMSQTAMHLVLTSDGERREILHRIGEELAGRFEELIGAETRPLADLLPDPPEHDPREVARLQARRWATELDINHYQAEPAGEDRVKITVGYPGDVAAGLAEAGGRRARAALDMGNLMFRAARCRDGQDDHDPVQLYNELTQARQELAAAGPPAGDRHEADAVAAVAATLILGPSRGADIPDADLAWAARELLDVARRQAEAPRTWHDTPNQQWHLGADRSAATALPMLLADAALRKRVGTNLAAVSEAIDALAGSFFAEVRTRLSTALKPALKDAGANDPAGHDAAVTALREMVATAGRGPWDQNGRPYVRLLEPLNDTITSDDLRLDAELAAPAIPSLACAAASDHPQSHAAADLFEAIVVYDLARWPAEFARRHFIDVDDWRRELDQVTAERALDGDPVLLHRYLAAFRPVAEELRGILTAMADLAVTPERTAAFHQTWPAILDALLPPGRQLQLVNGRKAMDLDVEQLDEALLPLPPDNAPWPTEQTADLVWRWVRAYPSTPHLAARLITVLLRLGWLASPGATQAVLTVLGTEIAAIMRRPSIVVAWLRLILKDRPEAAGTYTARAQHILDGLAAAGHEAALRLQQEMEA